MRLRVSLAWVDSSMVPWAIRDKLGGLERPLATHSSWLFFRWLHFWFYRRNLLTNGEGIKPASSNADNSHFDVVVVDRCLNRVNLAT